MDKFYHIPGKINIADIATRTGVKLEDIGPDSEWQKGSGYVYTPCDGWPVSREFRGEVPQDEKRETFHSQFSVARFANLSKVDEMMNYSDDLTKVWTIVARFLRVFCQTKQKKLKKSDHDIKKIMSKPDPDNYRKADHAMRIFVMDDTGKNVEEDQAQKPGTGVPGRHPLGHREVRWNYATSPGHFQACHSQPREQVGQANYDFSPPPGP